MILSDKNGPDHQIKCNVDIEHFGKHLFIFFIMSDVLGDKKIRPLLKTFL